MSGPRVRGDILKILNKGCVKTYLEEIPYKDRGNLPVQKPLNNAPLALAEITVSHKQMRVKV